MGTERRTGNDVSRPRADDGGPASRYQAGRGGESATLCARETSHRAYGVQAVGAASKRQGTNQLEAAGERTRHRARSGDARLWRYVGGARQWQRRSGVVGSVRPARGSARQAEVFAAARVAQATGRERLLLRCFEQRVVAVVSHRVRAAGLQSE